MKKLALLGSVLIFSSACSANHSPEKSIVVTCTPSLVSIDTVREPATLIYNGHIVRSGKIKEECELNPNLTVQIDIDLGRKEENKITSQPGEYWSSTALTGVTNIAYKEGEKLLATFLITKSEKVQLQLSGDKFMYCPSKRCVSETVGHLKSKPADIRKNVTAQR